MASVTVLLLHLMVAGLSPLADARFERGGRAIGAHLESEERSSCPPAHDHLLCQFCRQLDTRLAGAQGFQGAFHHQVRCSVDAAPRSAAARGVLLGLPLGSRAPPAA